MKIYPCEHPVKIKRQIAVNDVQLAYLSNNEQGRTVTVKLNKDFASLPEKHKVQPYDAFSSSDFYLFNQKNEPVNAADKLSLQNGRYFIKPGNVIAESAIHDAERFTYQVRIKKEDTFRKDVSYNINIAAGSEPIAQKISSLFCGTLPEEYPNNITFNDGTLSYQSFFTRNKHTLDFLFITLNDLNSIASDKNKTTQDVIDEYLDDNICLWIFDDNFNSSISAMAEKPIYSIEDPQIFSEVTGAMPGYWTTDSYLYFTPESTWNVLPSDQYRYVSLFTSKVAPVQIIFKEKGGFVVLAHNNMLQEISQYDSLILEVMMHIYLHTYYTTEIRSSFVTDDPIDYFLNTNQYYGLCHPRISLTSILYEEKFNVNIVYIIDEIICHNGHAEGTGVNRYNELQFRKLSQRLKDREKGNNILTYTKNKTLLLQRKEDDPFYTIETGAEVTVKDDMTLQIWPMLSSKYRIVSSDVCFLTVPSAGKYALIYDHTVNKFAIVSTYESLTQTPIATIEVEDNTDIVFRDIRIPGGGEQSPVPNYEMIDTGSLKGRPLRYGSLFVIELPERFKGMKDVLKTEVEKHMTSGDYPIFVFKD